ncbi:MAG: LysM peptidoglycan-binding domain-containing protein [Prevotella sp.]|nr:LysM peptidoglycan-binding domain-containing protein [Prevotella sp.]
MRRFLRHVILALVWVCSLSVTAQSVREQYKAKKKDTVFGIARQYGITIEELAAANPQMQASGYQLKKGEVLNIPYPLAYTPTKQSEQPDLAKSKDAAGNRLRVGIMLPLHSQDGDGRRMVEYYRGFLMGCDSLRRQGLSIDIHAWNVSADADVRTTLLESEVAKCDIIFGPLYTKQVSALSNFCQLNGIKLVIPFSISGNDVEKNPQIFKVYQSAALQTDMAVSAFQERFSGYHPVFVDCNDSTSKKGSFTSALRMRLDEKAHQAEASSFSYNITNVRSTAEQFSKAFSRTQPNVVVLNTARSPELNMVLSKLDALCQLDPSISVSLFGYTEWLMYLKNYQEYFHRYDAYIPTNFFYNPFSPQVKSLEDNYRKWFGEDMQYALPRFAVTGYDHAQYFLRGIHLYGKGFTGDRGQSAFFRPLQTPLHFKQAADRGGRMNDTFMLIHYKRDHTIDAISY